MTESTKTIFEKYQVRKTKAQKTEFIEYVKGIADENGYSFNVETGSFGSRNIIVGDVDNAKVIYTAHYDTCAVLPFPNFITPKNFLIYLLYQFIIILPIFAAAFLIGILSGLTSVYVSELAGDIVSDIAIIGIWVLLALLVAGPANKNTANDNTSGVTTLIDIINAIDGEAKEKTAFVFFDLEEAGLFGSSSFASKHKNVKNNTLVLNFDCVSDGENILLAVKKGAKQFIPLLSECFPDAENINSEVATKVFYPSDQANFKYGVGVCALKRSKRGILYMDRIHTKHDTVYREVNIEYLRSCAIALAEKI